MSQHFVMLRDRVLNRLFGSEYLDVLPNSEISLNATYVPS
jgi:hypothetical protein